ncbi:integrase core domain-containing protein [Candidatus Acetothermia bacterium]|jgi:transposase-like protein|nr:integrase core domain-containing protein [Candidatus Acetothermia bacterium]MCI2427248.1 integrase core domain-containing protein [Candidatus Acetothermia bacterium]MCI2428760.1 integrase core domain-containing protein [Candidatus Acetothermia bacterium]
MKIRLHKNATTTLAIRKAIKESPLSAYALAKKYGLSPTTALRWKRATSLEDKSSRPKVLQTTLSPAEEERICFERKQFKKTIEDIFFSLEGEIPNLYPMKIYRCLKRYNLSLLPNEFADAERKIKKFRRYGIGYLHIDLLYGPKINGQRSYIYTAIDRVAKIAFVMIGKNKQKETGAKFLRAVLDFYPYKINYILTDSGFEFTYKALPKDKRTKKIHPFEEICRQHEIKHHTIKFKYPWTNGMVERFNRTAGEQALPKYRFESIFEMNSKLIEFINRYNFETRLKSLNYKTPAQYLKEQMNIVIERIVI